MINRFNIKPALSDGLFQSVHYHYMNPSIWLIKGKDDQTDGCEYRAKRPALDKDALYWEWYIKMKELLYPCKNSSMKHKAVKNIRDLLQKILFDPYLDLLYNGLIKVAITQMDFQTELGKSLIPLL